MSNRLLNKRLMIVAILAVGAASIILVASSFAQATAQREQQKMMWAGEGMPQINGSVNVASEASNFISENVKVSFVAAAETAQGQANNEKVIGGHLGVLQGYLVYTFFVANTVNQTGHISVIDAGNGNVLYTSEGQPLGSLGHYGQWGGHGFGGWHGQGKHGFGWGMWH